MLEWFHKLQTRTSTYLNTSTDASFERHDQKISEMHDAIALVLTLMGRKTQEKDEKSSLPSPNARLLVVVVPVSTSYGRGCFGLVLPFSRSCAYSHPSPPSHFPHVCAHRAFVAVTIVPSFSSVSQCSLALVIVVKVVILQFTPTLMLVAGALISSSKLAFVIIVNVIDITVTSSPETSSFLCMQSGDDVQQW